MGFLHLRLGMQIRGTKWVREQATKKHQDSTQKRDWA
jgi:hypothetical protein